MCRNSRDCKRYKVWFIHKHINWTGVYDCGVLAPSAGRSGNFFFPWERLICHSSENAELLLQSRIISTVETDLRPPLQLTNSDVFNNVCLRRWMDCCHSLTSCGRLPAPQGAVVKTQTAENHVTWRVSSMAALSWGSNSTGLTPIAWLSLASLVTCLFAGPGRRWRPERAATTRPRNAATTTAASTAAAVAFKGRKQ